MADQEHIEQGEPSGLTLEDLCGGPVAADCMRHIPQPGFAALVGHLHHQPEVRHQLLSNMKADFDQKWGNRERAMQDQMEAQRPELANVFNEECRQGHIINHSSSFAGLCGGSPCGPSGMESTKSTTCPALGSDGKVRWLRLRSTSHDGSVLGLGMRQILWLFQKITLSYWR